MVRHAVEPEIDFESFFERFGYRSGHRQHPGLRPGKGNRGLRALHHRRKSKDGKGRGGRQRGEGDARKNAREQDRKSTRLNSSHGYISYAVFCLKKKKKI